MPYTRGIQRITEYVTDGGRIIELNHNKSNVQENYQEIADFDGGKKLAIRFPGYKTTKDRCDYCVYLVDSEREKAISHVEIMRDLYRKTTRANYNSIKNYVETVARIGIGTNVRNYPDIDFNVGFDFDELTGLMFYIAIQEDINYPEERHQGRKMCFYRYLEAIYCRVYDNHNLNEAIEKANARGVIPQRWNDVGALYDNVSNITREQPNK